MRRSRAAGVGLNAERMTGEDARRYIDGQRVQIAHVHPDRKYLWSLPADIRCPAEQGKQCQRTPGINAACSGAKSAFSDFVSIYFFGGC
jgi:hypothetical protein